MAADLFFCCENELATYQRGMATDMLFVVKINLLHTSEVWPLICFMLRK